MYSRRRGYLKRFTNQYNLIYVRSGNWLWREQLLQMTIAIASRLHGLLTETSAEVAFVPPASIAPRSSATAKHSGRSR